MSVFVLPYKTTSKSARDIARSTGGRVIKLDASSKYKPRKGHLVINWGSCSLPDHVVGSPIINKVPLVARAANKLVALRAFQEAGVSIPDFTESKDEAISWINDGHVVLCRTLLRGSGGAGIIIAEKPDQLADCKLYTKYVKKLDEYRVHVMGDEVFDIQRKMRRTDVPDDGVNWKIRNHSTGFIFGRENVNPPDAVLNESLKAIKALGLDFGAVDVMWNAHYSKPYVLEVNTAPGLEGTTLERYSEALKKCFLKGTK